MMNIDNFKVSIIVPVYNVEQYLSRCITSILSQDYKNIELILVNDGSTDASGAVCDTFASKDERVRVFHKKNSGSSDARNLGIDSAEGEYLMFIDSDDYVNPRIVSTLLRVAVDSDVSMAACGYSVVGDEAVVFNEGLTEGQNMRLLDREDALSELMYQKGLTNSPWSKIFHKDLFTDIRYPSGKINQDLGTIYKIVAKAPRLAVITDPLYCYVQRQGSIINSPFSLKRMAGLEFAQEALEFIESKHPIVENAARNRLFTEAVSVLLKIRESDDPSNFIAEQWLVWRVIRGNRLAVLIDKSSRTQPRLSAFISYFGIHVFSLSGIWFKRRVLGRIRS